MISKEPHSDRPGDSEKHTAGASAEHLGGRMKEHIHAVADDAKKKGRSLIEQQKHQLAQTMHHVCEALQSASQKLHEEHDDVVANYTEAISEKLDNAANYVDRMDVNEAVDNVADFARRQPHVFLGGMFLIGLAAARFLKASPTASHNPQRTGGSPANPKKVSSPPDTGSGSITGGKSNPSASPATSHSPQSSGAHRTGTSFAAPPSTIDPRRSGSASGGVGSFDHSHKSEPSKTSKTPEAREHGKGEADR